MDLELLGTERRQDGLRREAFRLGRFCAVGVTNALLSFVVFAVLCRAGCPAPIASGIGFCAGACNSFQLNRRWTFSDLAMGPGTGVRFAAVQAFGALLSVAGVAALQAARWPHLLAECGTVPLVTVCLYGLNRRLVFRPLPL